MKILTILNAFLVLAEALPSDSISASFVRDYYDDRNIQQIVVFGCWNAHDYFRFTREVGRLGMRISSAKINNNIDMKRLLKVDYYAIGVVLDYDCPRSEIVFDEFSEHRLPFNESYHWLVLTETTTIPTEVLSRLALTVESEMTFAGRQRNSYVLRDVYNPSYRHNGRLNVTFKGSWTIQNGLKNELTQYKYIRRGNFHGLALNFSIVINNPALPDFETYIKTPINRHLDTMIRYHYALILQLRDTYNFTINLQRAKTWGYLVNGTWNGVLADMIDGLVDISVAPFHYKAERMDICEYTVETYTVRLRFIFRHPKKNNVRNPFLKPFIPNVWYSIAAIGAIFYIVLFSIAKVEENIHDKGSHRSINNSSPSKIDLVVVAAIAQQGSVIVPRIISGRIVFISIFLWGLLIYQFYSASIVGSLLAQQPRFIKTTAELGESNIDVWFEDMLYYDDYFRTTTDPSALTMYEKKVKPTTKRPNGSYTNAINGLSLVKKGGYAFHIETATAYKIIADTFSEDEICDLQEIEMIEPKKVAIVTSKKSPFKKMIIYGAMEGKIGVRIESWAYRLRRIVQHGLTDALNKIWITASPKCPESHNMTPVPVQVEEFSPAIFLLLVGSTSAIIIMIFENCCKSIYERFCSNEFSRTIQETTSMTSENIEEKNNESITYEQVP